MNMQNIFIVLSLFTGLFCVALGFNTIDQMIIRYKYYDDWRALDTWEMSYFWTPHWWDIYVSSILMLFVGGVLLGVDVALLLRRAVSKNPT